jgi:hypothetical protein
MDFQGLLPVTLFTLGLCLTSLSYDSLNFFFVDPIARWVTRAFLFKRHYQALPYFNPLLLTSPNMLKFN